MIESAAAHRTTVSVCITCKEATGSPESPQAGLALAEATAVAANLAAQPDQTLNPADIFEVRVQRVRCLGNCSRGPSAAIRHGNAWTYVFGGLDPARDAVSLIEGARLLARATDGLMPWRGRPEPLKRGLIARVPPVDFHEEPA